MGNAVHGDCHQSRIRNDDFLRGFCRGVARKRSLHVQPHLAADFRNFLDECKACLLSERKAVGSLHIVVLHHMDERLLNFAREHGHDAVHAFAGYKAQRLPVNVFRGMKAGEDKRPEILQHSDDILPVGEVLGFLKVYAAVFFV